jgi:hypothetical protein
VPCYQVQTCNVELNNADHRLLGKALKRLGYNVVQGSAGHILSFSKGSVTGTYDGKKLTMSGQGAKAIDTDEIKREYARQVVLKKVDQAQNAGWSVEKEGDEWVFRKPQGTRAKVFA